MEDVVEKKDKKNVDDIEDTDESNEDDSESMNSEGDDDQEKLSDEEVNEEIDPSEPQKLRNRKPKTKVDDGDGEKSSNKSRVSKDGNMEKKSYSVESAKTSQENLKETNSNKESQKEKGSSNKCLIFVLVLIAVAVSSTLLPSDMLKDHNYNTPKVFEEKLMKMKKDFPNQESLIWNMLKNGGGRHLKKVLNDKKEELTPLSYLFAGYADSSETVDCFLLKLAHAYTETTPGAHKHRILDASEFSGDNDREKLRNAILRKLVGEEKLLIIKDIDKLPFPVAQLFMAFADEHNRVASYPQSVLFLTTEVPFSYDPVQGRHIDEGNVGEHFKTNVWGGVPIDLSSPLWSRVGDGLVLIRKEEKNPCKVDGTTIK